MPELGVSAEICPDFFFAVPTLKAEAVVTELPWRDACDGAWVE